MAEKFNETPYRPKVMYEAYLPDFTVENDFDYITPYPCGVCGEVFNSRYGLATHKHQKKGAA